MRSHPCTADMLRQDLSEEQDPVMCMKFINTNVITEPLPLNERDSDQSVVTTAQGLRYSSAFPGWNCTVITIEFEIFAVHIDDL